MISVYQQKYRLDRTTYVRAKNIIQQHRNSMRLSISTVLLVALE
jgi:hypothetical protein